MRSSKKVAIATLAMAAAISGTAIAQDQNQPPQQSTSQGWSWGPHGMMGPGMMGHGGSWMMGANGSAEAMCGAMASHIEGRLGFVKAELKVTDAQEALWNAYAAAARDNASTMIARCTTMMSRRGEPAGSA
jgi:hypothetical protein